MKQNVQRVIKYMKRPTTMLVNRNMKIKTTIETFMKE